MELGRADTRDTWWRVRAPVRGRCLGLSRVDECHRTLRLKGRDPGLRELERIGASEQDRVLVPRARRAVRVAVPHGAQVNLGGAIPVVAVAPVMRGTNGRRGQRRRARHGQTRQRDDGGSRFRASHAWDSHCVGAARQPPERGRPLEPRQRWKLTNPATRATDGPPAARSTSDFAAACLDADDVERLIASCDPPSRVGRRDRAILLLLARLGLRAGDIVQLRLRDIPPAVFGAETRRRPVPYILSPDQIRQLIHAASQSGYRTLRRQTYSTLFALLPGGSGGARAATAPQGPTSRAR